MLNVGWTTEWSFVDGLGFNPKADPETIALAILILRQVASLHFVPESLLTGNLEDIAPTMVFTCTRRPQRSWWSLVSGGPQTQALRSQVQCSIDHITTDLHWNWVKEKKWCNTRKNRRNGVKEKIGLTQGKAQNVLTYHTK